MSARAGHYHRFEAAGRDFLYLVQSAAVFGSTRRRRRARHLCPERQSADSGDRSFARRGRSVRLLADRFDEASVKAAIGELVDVRAIGYEQQPDDKPPRLLPLTPFPLTTMVMNVTNQCNLGCTYCYEYGEDKIVDTENGKQAEVHDRGDGARERRVRCSRGGRQHVAHSRSSAARRC